MDRYLRFKMFLQTSEIISRVYKISIRDLMVINIHELVVFTLAVLALIIRHNID